MDNKFFLNTSARKHRLKIKKEKNTERNLCDYSIG